MSVRDSSPRPAELLPPTLLPNPVLLAAPGPDRATSLLLACGVYCALGAAVLGGGRTLASHRNPVTGGPWQIVDPTEVPALPQARPLPPPSGAGTRPAGFTPVAPAADANVVPVNTPDTLNLQDRSREIGASADAPVGPRVDGATPEPAPPAPLARAGGAVEVDFQQIRILHQVQPVYPALARLVKAQGAVELRMTIDETGVPTEVDVISGPHALLINEAVRVARLWRFQPATLGGAAVAATFRLTVGFRLER